MRFCYFLLLTFMCIIMIDNVFAHTEINIDQYSINIGWKDEPPIIGFINNITFEINEVDQTNIKNKVKNAFKNLEAYVKFGGISKKLNISSLPTPGNYFAKIIPSKPGSYRIELHGKINDSIIDASIPIDRVKDSKILKFPDSYETTISDKEITTIKNIISSLSKDVDSLNNSVKPIDSDISNNDKMHDISILALTLSFVGIILSIAAIIKIK